MKSEDANQIIENYEFIESFLYENKLTDETVFDEDQAIKIMEQAIRLFWINKTLTK